MRPPYWCESYPQGTKEGDEEQAFFIALSRDEQKWRTTDALAGQTGLSKERVEQLIDKYIRKHMVFQHERNDNQWAYWERCPELVPIKSQSLQDKDHDERINKLKQGFDNSCDMIDNSKQKIFPVLLAFAPSKMINPCVVITDRDFSQPAEFWALDV